MPRPTQGLHDSGQSIWLDNITRGLLQSDRLQHYIDELSVTGLTSNPTIFDQAITKSSDYDGAIQAAADDTPAEELFFQLALEDLTRAADLFRPVHDRDRWGGRLGLTRSLPAACQRRRQHAR